MLIDLMDRLRCPARHEESWLVLSVDAWRDRHVLEGRLGCPVCHAEYPIHEGFADFAGRGALAGRGEPLAPADVALEPELLLRLAAQLDLRGPGGIVLVSGRYASLARGLAALTGIACVVANVTRDTGPEVSSLGIGDRIPLSAGTLRGAAVDDSSSREALLLDVARVLTAGGRLVAPSGAPVPAGIREIARDDIEWVGVAEPLASPLTLLKRGEASRPGSP